MATLADYTPVYASSANALDLIPTALAEVVAKPVLAVLFMAVVEIDGAREIVSAAGGSILGLEKAFPLVLKKLLEDA